MMVVALALSWYKDDSKGWPASHGRTYKPVRTFNKQRLQDITQALKAFEDEKSFDKDILLFPMQTLIRAYDDPKDTLSLQTKLEKTISKHGPSVKRSVFEVIRFRTKELENLSPAVALENYVENTENRLVITGKKTRSIYPAQFLADSKQADIAQGKFAVHRVASAMSSDLRSFTHKGKRICVLNCGETSIFRNEQSNNNRAVGRYGLEDTQPWTKHDVILNPFHVTMGNMAKHRERWKRLSEDGRHLIAVGNNQKDTWKSVLYHFHDGEEVGNGEEGDLFMSENDDWRALICEI